MAMNGDTLGKEIADAITSLEASPEAKASVLALWKKISNVIVKHIQTNAEVPANIAVAVQVSVDPVSHQGGGSGSTTGTGKVQ